MQRHLLELVKQVRLTFLRDYNLAHNILELYNVSVQIRLTTSKWKRGIWYRKLGIPIVSLVAAQINV